MKFDESGHWPNKRRVGTVPPWINQSPTNLDVVAPIRTRAYDALQAVLRSKLRRPGADSRLMRRGVERC